MSHASPKPAAAEPAPDGDLLEAYRRSGAAEEFERIVRRYGALVIAECRRVTRNAHDAEDAAQLCFLSLAVELRGGARIVRPAAWLQRVAQRQALKIVRSRGRRKRREEAVRRSETAAGDVTVNLDAADREATGDLIRQAIDELPERHRLPLILHYFGGMSLEAIAKELGITRTAVGTRLHRARKQLGDRLTKRGVRFDAGELGAWIAVVVPAAVVARLAGSTACPGTSSVTPHAFVVSVTKLLAAAGARPIAAGAVVVLCAGAGSLGRVAPQHIWQQVKEQIELPTWIGQWLEPSEIRLDVPSLPILSDRTIDGSNESADLAIATLTAQHVPLPSSTFERSESLPPTTSVEAIRASPLSSSASEAPAMASPVARVTVLPLRTSTTAACSSVFGYEPLNAQALSTRALLSIGSFGGESVVFDPSQDLVFDTVRIGPAAFDSGTVVQRGGHVRVDNLVIGDIGIGSYRLRDRALLETGSLTLARRPGSQGSLRVGPGSTVNVRDDRTPIRIGQEGAGRLILGSAAGPGRLITASGADVSLIVRESESARGLVQGWGDIQTRGSLINNGRVVADGFDHLRSLDISQASSVSNTIDNPRDGTNGWYARRGGRVQLPPVPVTSGTATYTWGESADDQTLDLVNSLRFTVHGQPTSTALNISLRTVAVADPLDVPLPQQAAIFGLWQIGGSSFDPSELDLVVRYDHVAADQYFLGESATRLLAYGGGAWHLAGSERIDLTDHVISGSFTSTGRVQYFAVGTFFDDPFKQTLTLAPMTANRTAGFISARAQAVVTPEPAAAVALLATTLILASRRCRCGPSHPCRSGKTH